MKRKLPITLGHSIERHASLDVTQEDTEASYRVMSADQPRERETTEWAEGLIADSSLPDPHISR